MTEPERIAALLERLGRILQNEAHADDLKPAQWEALRYLARANRFSRRPSAVTAYLGVTKGTVSQTLNALERKGLIAKKAAGADRRNVSIEITRKGRALLKGDPLFAMEAAARTLPAKSAQSVEAGLAAILTETLRRRGGHPFGACRTCRHFRKNAKAGDPHYCALLDEPLSAPDGDMICVEQEPA